MTCTHEQLELIEETFASYEARKIAKELGIRTIQDWNEAYRSGKIPNNLPMNLSNVYGQNYKKHLRNKK